MSKPSELKGRSGLQVAGKDQGGPGSLGGLHGGGRACRRAGPRQAWGTCQWLAVSSLTLVFPQPSRLPFSFSKGVGVASREGGDREKNKTPGRQFTSDLRQGNIYSPIHEPGSGEHPQLGTPGFMLVSGLDVRPEPPVFSQWHRVQPYTLSVCAAQRTALVAVEK